MLFINCPFNSDPQHWIGTLADLFGAVVVFCVRAWGVAPGYGMRISNSSTIH
ncbi:uncharacterized protein K452DRAFT_291444 [Aplosporella prunicola CBS 121167]|uniref:Uncharacterized protein n=1 Tax=Aplosporella prunicola CBS 121167 TaxID=1176127 RepID=A0A6A6B300_9PEZI|nr:uncharacterized protein K452DRAFT_291444 [Aplosporella prunicola CBS 121167]KAF2137625.1 hypothetical protein K452DRAFT_291444 [Aplosporella prunicola CBS 121167]